MPADRPFAEYRSRLDAARSEQVRHARRESVTGNGRVAAFALGVLTFLIVLGGFLAPAWLLVPAALFLAVGAVHERVVRAGRRAGAAVAYYERGLARLEDRWAGGGNPGTRFLDPEHPCAADLDLFGSGSVFELLCAARTAAGEATLAGWLLRPAEPEEVRARQAAVADLRPRLDLREDLALLGGAVRAGVHAAALADWGAAPPQVVPHWARPVTRLLAAAALASLVAWLGFNLGPVPFLAVFLLEMSVVWRLTPVVKPVLAAVDQSTHDLRILAGTLARLEREPFTAPRLLALKEAFQTEGEPPSRRIADLAHLVDRLDWRRNVYFAPLGGVLLWTQQYALAVEAWRIAYGPAVGRWLEAVGEFEALGSLAGHAYENPADPFPEVVAEGPRFDGVGLGHPLLPLDRCVRNDARLDDRTRLLIVSGSNMSGKSTLLRTVGVNAVLALAGAPVRAERLVVSPLVVGATLRIQDSLQAGRSRFYAEIVRLKQLVDLAAGRPPLLFLLDEILHGTNSHDRRLGAEAVLVGLLGRGAVGLVTTHDLALTEVVQRLGERAVNVHFEDTFEGETLHFDYRMRSGVVRHSNALALMRAVGLENV